MISYLTHLEKCKLIVNVSWQFMCDFLQTACADAYLTPHIKKYVRSFSDGFTDLKVMIITMINSIIFL